MTLSREAATQFAKVLSEALPYMREAVDGRRRVLGASHPFAIESLEAMIEFHDAWHEADPDGGHDVKAAEYRQLLEEARAEAESTVPLSP